MTTVIEFAPHPIGLAIHECEFPVASLHVSKHMADRMSKGRLEGKPNAFADYYDWYMLVMEDKQEIGCLWGRAVVVDYALADDVMILQGTGVNKYIKAKEPE